MLLRFRAPLLLITVLFVSLVSSTPFQAEPALLPRQQPQNSTLSVCSPLLDNLGSPTVLTPFEFEFRDAASSAWNLYNTLYTPTCIVHPRTVEDVSRVMKAIYDAGGVKYAVQAGGHSAMREWDTSVMLLLCRVTLILP